MSLRKYLFINLQNICSQISTCSSRTKHILIDHALDELETLGECSATLGQAPAAHSSGFLCSSSVVCHSARTSTPSKGGRGLERLLPVLVDFQLSFDAPFLVIHFLSRVSTWSREFSATMSVFLFISVCAVCVFHPHSPPPPFCMALAEQTSDSSPGIWH